MKRSLTAILAAGVLAASGLLAALPAQAAPAINWGPCSDPQLQAAKAQCGTLATPLDPANPKAGTVQIAMSMVKHTSPQSQYQGIMLVNPGGPGGSGVPWSTEGQYVPNGVGGQYDWIGFDPRGVGASTPSINCEPGYTGYDRPNYIPIPQANERTWLQRSRGYGAACAGYKNLLQHMKTTDTVADMEAIRKAMGAQQINYYGFSYGTYLGQVYSTLHPDRMRRMVLDSNVDPRKIWYPAQLDQDVAFDKNANIWFGWLAQHNDVYKLGNTTAKVRRLFYDQLPKLEAKPAGGKIGPDEWTDIFQGAPYYRSVWLSLGNAFSSWINKGDATPLLQQYAGTATPANENEFAVYNAVQCTDTAWPKDYQKWRQDAWTTYAKAPFLTWGNVWFNAPCLSWPAASGTPVNINGAKVSSGLLIDETLDAATPYEGSLEVRSRYPHTALIAEPGGTAHADSLYGDACVDNKIADYLAKGALPARKPGRTADMECAPLPDPSPTAPTAKALATKTQPTGRVPMALPRG